MPQPEAGISGALVPGSRLRSGVQAGAGALSRRDRPLFETGLLGDLLESLDLDGALQAVHPRDNRWDYLLARGTLIFGVEPHQARESEVTVVVRKKEWAERVLAGEFRPGRRVGRWFWVTRGRMGFGALDRVRRRLTSRGIEFVGRRLARKHIDPG